MRCSGPVASLVTVVVAEPAGAVSLCDAAPRLTVLKINVTGYLVISYIPRSSLSHSSLLFEFYAVSAKNNSLAFASSDV